MDAIPTGHRPWPLPDAPWVMRMRWLELAFLHWPVPAEKLRPLIPEGLELDTFDGSAWLGVVPFVMKDVSPRYVPHIPAVSDFAELNLRTYVRCGDKPGVWFFSLDAASRLGVRLARRFFHLPYFDAAMNYEIRGEEVFYESVRTHRGAPPAAFRGSYAPCGDVFTAKAGSIEHWLTERYCLYSMDRHGAIWRGEIHHAPWPLQPANYSLQENSLAQQVKIPLEGPPALAHFAKELDVRAWLIERVR
jgi:hypothetical protein